MVEYFYFTSEMGNSLYLIILLSVLILPLSYTFSNKADTRGNYKALIATILSLGLIFIGFEAVLISRGVIRFNSFYLVGKEYLGVPIEQFLYFLVLPYATIAIYELVRYASKKNIQLYASSTTILSIGTLFLLFTLATINVEYTFIVGLGVIATMAIFARETSLQNTDVVIYKIGAFLLFFLLQTVANSFAIIDYKSGSITDFRIGSVPIESLLYSYILITLYLTVYHHFTIVFSKKAPHH